MNALVTCTVYINIDARRDRQQHITQVLRDKLQVTQAWRLPATVCAPGYQGCTHSHIRALQLARALTGPGQWCLVLEDDFDLLPLPMWFDQVRQALQIPELDVLLLAVDPFAQLAPADHVGAPRQVLWSLTASGYLIRYDYIPQLLTCLQSALVQQIPLDVAWKPLQQRDRWYALPGGYQAPFTADVE